MSEEMLKQGIAAFKAGRTAEAGELFLQVLERDPDNEMAWLWLSGTVETERDRLECLERVVEINPYNGIAQRGIETLRRRVREPVTAPAAVARQAVSWAQATAESEPAAEAAPTQSETGTDAVLATTETDAEFEPTEGEAGAEAEPVGVTDRIYVFLRQAVDAIKAGDQETGQTLLVEALNLDEDNEVAWLWMTRCVDEIDLKRECFERVLEINPENTRAIRGLKRLDAALEQAAATAEEGTPEVTREGGEGSASVRMSGWGRRVTMMIGMVAAVVLVAVLLLAILG
jgi:tetratricopeptide (TPR) repeat protein